MATEKQVVLIEKSGGFDAVDKLKQEMGFDLSWASNKRDRHNALLRLPVAVASAVITRLTGRTLQQGTGQRAHRSDCYSQILGNPCSCAHDL